MGLLYVGLILVTGFIFTELYFPTRYGRRYKDGWEIYAQMLLFGTLFFVLSYPLLAYLDFINIGRDFLKEHGIGRADLKLLPLDIHQTKLLVWWVCSSLLSALSGIFTKYWYWLLPYKKEKKVESLLIDSAFDLMIYRNIKENEIQLNNNMSDAKFSYLQVVLDGGKVYVGVCTSAQIGKQDLDSILFSPVLSGYRDKDTHRLEFTTNYFDHQRKLDLTYIEFINQYQIALKTDSIKYVSKFQPEAYSLFNPIEPKPE